MDRRQDILITAGGLFVERGYHATSIRDIARELKLRGSSLYAHIDAKEDVLWEIVGRAADAFLAQASAVDTGLPPAVRLEALIRGHLSVVVRELPNATVFFHEWKFLSAERKQEIIARRDAYEGHFRAAVEDGMAAGVFRAEDAKTATRFVLSALNWTYQWYREGGRLSLEELSEQYVNLCLGALGTHAERTED